MRQYYHTTYPVGDSKYSSYFLAEDDKEAKAIVKARKLREVFSAPCDIVTNVVHATPFNLIRRLSFYPVEQRDKVTEVLHLLCWLLNLAEVSGRWKRKGVFSDTGFIHQVIHLSIMSPAELGSSFDKVYEQALEIQAATPEMFLTDAEIKYLRNKNETSCERHVLLKRLLEMIECWLADHISKGTTPDSWFITTTITSFLKGHCGIDIPKPLFDHFHRLLWSTNNKYPDALEVLKEDLMNVMGFKSYILEGMIPK